MSLSPGARLGPYEVLSAIGAGGMGEVWRARDSKLGRDVALKILPGSLATDVDRLARFQREARVLASLNHPNIAAIYGLEESDGVRALVLELVEGPTLADRIARGPIPLDAALAIGRQIADALHAAHDHGIVHRDLKPSNIKLRTDGTVKVLDFGLAKTVEPMSAGEELESPTITSPAFTGVGVILGTAAYMAPEQARGQAVDKRADIWAFGVVLFEMLTGTRPFNGPTVVETLASVVTAQPAWDLCPARSRRLLRACLRKDPNERLHDIADAAMLLDEGEIGGEPKPGPPGARIGPRMMMTIAVVCLGVAGVITAWAPWRSATPRAELLRLHITLPGSVSTAGRNFTLSPDGHTLAFSAAASDGVPRVWIRPMDSLEVRALPETETTPTAPPFFWSHDSRFVGYSSAGGKLKKVDLVGSPPQTLADTVGQNAPGGCWNRDGVILFGSVSGPLSRVSASGGPRVPATVLDGSRKETRHAFPTFLSDGRRFLYLRTSSIPENSGVYVGSIDAKARGAGFQAARRDEVRSGVRRARRTQSRHPAHLSRRKRARPALR